MSVADLLNGMPFADHMGIDVVEAADGRAVVELPMHEDLSSVPGRKIAHGGVTYALADTAAGAAVISLHHKPTPTVDMRMDYLAPATTDLRAEATVVRDGGSVATAEVRIEDVDGTHVANARGTFKTGGGGDGGAWGVTPGDDSLDG
ncbi:PaaI family thioesterase [Halobaculum magnesiiphilum]|uniref:PaaI family thioesterase n=1 Tax=Halobaculum magnesiiphilum TaxID=1017351 RepID=A0A8T8WAX0_9EURY|nr:PaaI family thioesterase [Halobaculum magnesiiphilum]QZP36971.1 PaaI family thioesterase [Halobaculum magnesiiphilum]